MGARARHVCPICGREAAPREASAKTPANPSFPFCSPACKLVDLGKWLDGTYRIPDDHGSSDEATEAPENSAARREDDE